MPVPRVAAIHDLAGVGRCSLTAAIPVLAAMGIQACPMPTGVLSCQTGYPSYSFTPLTEDMEAFVDQWHKNALSFQGIYTGFLCDEKQALIARRCIETFPCETILVDPVLGDEGMLYPVFSSAMVEAVGTLVEVADIITPNLTEACLLTEQRLEDVQSSDTIWSMAERLAERGPSIVVITGVEQKGAVANFLYLRKSKERHVVSSQKHGGGYTGTGDVFASVVCGALVQGEAPLKAVKQAAAFLEYAIAKTVEEGTPLREGIAFEPVLQWLMKQEGRHSEQLEP